METTFEITHDREFLKHFITRWRTLSITMPATATADGFTTPIPMATR